MPHATRRTVATAALAALALCAHATAGEPQRYEFDPVHTRVMFAIDHAGFSKAIGTVSGSSGSLYFDPADWTGARLDVSVPMTRLDMGDSGWSASVFAPRFLDVRRYPQARFVADQVTRGDGNHGRACGQLTLHGISQPLSIPFTFNRVANTIYGLHTIAGFSATAMLDRETFGITANAGSIGQQVSVWLELEAIRDEHAIPASKEQP